MKQLGNEFAVAVVMFVFLKSVKVCFGHSVYGIIQPVDINVGQILSARPPEMLKMESINFIRFFFFFCSTKTELSHFRQKLLILSEITQFSLNLSKLLPQL